MNLDRFKAPDTKDEPKVIDKCMDCSEDILEDDTYYDVAGHIICENCIDYYKKVAETDD